MNTNKTINHKKIFATKRHFAAPALFLDRDGVIVEESHYLRDPKQVKLCMGIRQLISLAYEADLPVVVITNQSGIARGRFNWEAYEQVTNRMLELLGPNAPIAAIYSNGNGPDAPLSSWRKPSPAMLIEAAENLNLDLRNSLMIGDRLSDLQAGVNAGLAILVHVLSGHGKSERPRVVNYFERGEHLTGGNHQSQLLLLDSLKQFPMPLIRGNSKSSM